MAGEVVQPNPEQKIDIPVSAEAKHQAKQALEKYNSYVEYVEKFGTEAVKKPVRFLKLIAGVE